MTHRKPADSDDDIDPDDELFDDDDLDGDDFDDDDEFDDGLDDELEAALTGAPRRGRTGQPNQLKSRSDRLVFDLTPTLTGPSVLVLLMHGTTLASALREARPDLKFTFYTPEHFYFRTLQQFHADAPNTTLVCAADLPDGTFDEVIFPTLLGDSSEVAQELIQSAHMRLKTGGRLIASTNNPKDRWVQSQLKALFSRVDVHKQKHGVSFVATRSTPLKKPRGFRARSAFRLGERLIFCESRPGVFSHRRIDGGARALIKSLAMLTSEDESKPVFAPRRIVEMGCGCGAVSMAAAVEFPEARILAIDSDARAIDCTEASARLNQILNVETLLTSDGKVPESRSWDLLLGNPPYYSDYRISELFLQTAKSCLRPGGRVHIVTKLLDWHGARMKQLFKNVQAHMIGEYTVFTAAQR